jgi:hypothetical protein
LFDPALDGFIVAFDGLPCWPLPGPAQLFPQQVPYVSGVVAHPAHVLDHLGHTFREPRWCWSKAERDRPVECTSGSQRSYGERTSCARAADKHRLRVCVARGLRLGRAMTRILVIDDDPAIRSVIGDALRQDGYQVDAAANGQQALTAFGKHRPDALVL